jgi:hypothetical protein
MFEHNHKKEKEEKKTQQKKSIRLLLQVFGKGCRAK